jgi:hypothetical protein
LHIPPKEWLAGLGATLDFPPEFQRACANTFQSFGNGGFKHQPAEAGYAWAAAKGIYQSLDESIRNFKISKLSLLPEDQDQGEMRYPAKA